VGLRLRLPPGHHHDPVGAVRPQGATRAGVAREVLRYLRRGSSGETIGPFLDQVKERLEDTKKEREQSLTRDEAVAVLPKVSMTAIHSRRPGQRSAHPVTGSDTDSAPKALDAPL